MIQFYKEHHLDREFFLQIYFFLFKFLQFHAFISTNLLFAFRAIPCHLPVKAVYGCCPIGIPDSGTDIFTSLKYKYYQQSIQKRQVKRTEKMLNGNLSSLKKHHRNDCKRFIKKTGVTSDGEIADKEIYELDQSVIDEEAYYDGFYAVCTNLDDDPADIAKINHDRWEIEESFRIMKTEFDARPVYLHRDDRIKAHFLTCFISLMIYRILEKQLDERFTCEHIISTLRKITVRNVGEYGYIPNYTRTELTDALHENAGFRTDTELTTPKAMAGIIRRSKGK